MLCEFSQEDEQGSSTENKAIYQKKGCRNVLQEQTKFFVFCNV